MAVHSAAGIAAFATDEASFPPPGSAAGGSSSSSSGLASAPGSEDDVLAALESLEIAEAAIGTGIRAALGQQQQEQQQRQVEEEEEEEHEAVPGAAAEVEHC